MRLIRNACATADLWNQNLHFNHQMHIREALLLRTRRPKAYKVVRTYKKYKLRYYWDKYRLHSQTKHSNLLLKRIKTIKKIYPPKMLPYLMLRYVSICRFLMASGIVLMQLWYKFNVSRGVNNQTSEGISVKRFLERSEK